MDLICNIQIYCIYVYKSINIFNSGELKMFEKMKKNLNDFYSNSYEARSLKVMTKFLFFIYMIVLISSAQYYNDSQFPLVFFDIFIIFVMFCIFYSIYFLISLCHFLILPTDMTNIRDNTFKEKLYIAYNKCMNIFISFFMISYIILLMYKLVVYLYL